jgi:Holliday junction resolvasome RuvABC endonuclease subunit
MIKTVAIDSSTKISGMSLFINGEYEEHTLIDHHKVKDVDERINLMIYDVVKQLQKWKPEIVWIEHPQGHGSNVDMVNKLSEVLGAVRCWCVFKNAEYNEINPSEWRKYLPNYSQGKKSRKELKQDAIDYVKKYLGMNCTTDEADSLCIGIAVVNMYKQFEE